MNTFLAVVGAVGALLAVILGSIQVRKGLAAAATADRERAADRVSEQIKDARDEERLKSETALAVERQQCKDRVQVVLDQLREMTADRNSERDQRIALQQQINNQMRGRG